MVEREKLTIEISSESLPELERLLGEFATQHEISYHIEESGYLENRVFNPRRVSWMRPESHREAEALVTLSELDHYSSERGDKRSMGVKIINSLARHIDKYTDEQIHEYIQHTQEAEGGVAIRATNFEAFCNKLSFGDIAIANIGPESIHFLHEYSEELYLE